MPTVYADSSALLAFMDPADMHHAAVDAAMRQLRSEGARVVTSSYAVVETAALVKRRLGSEAFRRFGNAVTIGFHVVWVDEPLHRRAWEHAAAEARRGPSLVDWVGFLVMRDLRITTALAVDRHFANQGFRLLPELPA